MKHTLISLTTLLCFCIASCQNNEIMTPKFEWNPGQSAPMHYPMEPAKILFTFSDGAQVGTMRKTAQKKWGTNDAGAAVGEPLKPVPIRVDITWLSYTENKFYTGSFNLPYEKMLSLFEKGWPDFNYTFDPPKPYSETFKEIIVGMAPGGLVVVWLSGPGHQVDIGAFQAHDTIIDMSAFVDILGHSHTKQNDNQDIFVDLEMKRNPISAANIKAHGIPYGLWEKYRQKFNYKPVIKFDQLEKIETTNIFMEFYNAEVESYNSANIYMDTFSMRAIIKQINLIWIGNWAGKKQKYSVIIEMDEPEIKQAFDEVYGKYYNEHAELLIEVNRGNDQYRIFLEGNGKKVELKNFKGDIMLGGK